MSTPRLAFLGAPRIERDGVAADLPAKAVALLAYLALQDAPQPRERLLDLLWPASYTDAGRKNLRNALWAVRKALGEEAVVAGDDSLALSPDVWVDTRELERLLQRRVSHNGAPSPEDTADVLRRYRGPFLDTLAVPDAPDFEIWLTTERERLAQLYLRAATDVIAAYQSAGRWRDILAVGERALAQDILQEPLHRAVMEAHARLGERPEALRQYDMLRAALARELGVEPLPETDALRAAILNGDVGPTQSPPPPAAVPRREPSTTPSTPATPFVGRQAERAILDEEWAAAAAGHVRVILLTGEMGIGKSRLWREWSASRGAETLILEGHALEATQNLPFAPVAEMLSRRADRLFTPASPIPRLWLAEMARLFPDIRARIPDLPAPVALPAEEERRRLFEALAQSVLALGGQPLILFLDDVQWADRATLDWLGYLADRLREAPLLIILAQRLEDTSPVLSALTAAWGRQGIARRVRIERLSPEEAASLIAALHVDPQQTHRIQAQSAGNPYFLVELARANARPTEREYEPLAPPALTEVIGARLDRLPASARQVLQAAAILEPDFDFATLRRVSGRGEEETLDAVDVLLAAGVFTESQGRYAFAHPLVAQVVRDALSSARRAFVSHRAAEALELTPPSRLPLIAGRLARLYADAGEPKRAALYFEMAAERALALAATDEAVDFYRQALALDPTPKRQLGLGRALLRRADLIDARAALEAALSGLIAAGDGHNAAHAAMDIAETYIQTGRFDAAVEWFRRSADYLDPQREPGHYAAAQFFLDLSPLFGPASPGEFEARLAEADRLAREHPQPSMNARVYFALGNQLAERGDLPHARIAYDRSIAQAHAGGDDYHEVLALNNAAYHALLDGDLVAAHDYVAQALALADARALRLPLQHLYSTQGEIALAEEHWAEAEGWFGLGLTEAARNGNQREMGNYRANLALAARGRGDLARASQLLEEARALVADSADVYLQIKTDLWLAQVCLEQGDRPAAEAALARAETALVGSDRALLTSWAARLRASLTP
ncbi:MAG: AAA family ATPase [Anaerolineae bacterium]